MRVIALDLLCLLLFSISGCTVAANLPVGSDIYCLNEQSPAYREVLAQALPAYSVGATTHVYTTLQQGNTLAVEAFDPQALPALAHGVAEYWYPQYLATVVIAVDRGRTNADIRGWRDLSAANEEIGVSGACMYDLMFSAIAYGL